MKPNFYCITSIGYGSRFIKSLFILSLMSLMFLTNVHAQTTLINPATDGGFENGSTFVANGWVELNGAQPNKWFVGAVAVPSAGSNCGYISSSATGATYDYNVNSSSVVQVYKEFTVPAGQSIVTLNFKWKGVAESCCDYLRVWVSPNTFTPVPGTQTTTTGGNVQLGGNLNSSASYTTSSFGTGLIPGNTYRLIFEWRNDGSIGPSPGAAIDEISLTAAAPAAFTATALGGLWSNGATWVGGVVPGSGNDINIPAGSIVTVDQVTSYGDLNIAGTVQWNATSNAMTLTGNLNINAGGKFLPYTTAAGGTTGITVNIAGNLINDGYANFAVGTSTNATINFNGNGSVLGGSGVFEGDGTRGIIRQLFFGNLGANSVTTTQPLTVYSLAHTAGTLNTNGKLKIDNTAMLFGAALNTQVASVHMTNMGTGYTVSPVVFGTAVTQWTASGTATANTRYFSGTDVYLCTAAGTFGVLAPLNVTPATEVNGTATVLWIGKLGTLGNPFQVTSVTVGTQYFCGDNLYVCTVAGTPTAGTAPIHTSGVAASGTASFRYVGSPAKVSVNYDGATLNVRSLSLVSGGSGYSSSSAPGLVFSLGVFGGAGSGAAATPVVLYSLFGPTNSLAQRSGVATVSGGLDINSDQGASLNSSGVGSLYTTNGGVNYTVAPVVGFAGPTAINLVTNQGSGYTTTPTVIVSGGNLVSGSALTTSNFTIAVNQGKIVAVYLNNSTTACYSVPPTLAFSIGTATLEFPAGCWPSATANIGSNGQISSFTMTNAGYGYVAAPTVGVGTTSGTANGGTYTTVATAPVSRVALYNLTANFFGPAATAVVSPDDAFIPTNRKMNNLSLAGNGNGLNLTSNLTLFGTSPLSLTASGSTPGNILNLGGNNLLFTWNGYAGTTSTFGATNTYLTNGSMTLTGRGGASVFNYPFEQTFTWFAGTTPTGANSGNTATTVTVSTAAAPSGLSSPSGSATGTRAYRVVANEAGFGAATFGLNPTVTLRFSANDGLGMTQNYLSIAEGSALTGPWTTRSAAYGASGSLPATGLLVTATSGSGPIVPTGDNYYAWVNTAPVPIISTYTPGNYCEGGGETVVISGSGFSGASAVQFNSVNAASYVVDNDNQITAVTPVGVSAGNITVTANALVATSAAYTVSLTGILSITKNPANGLICSAGGSVTIDLNNIGADSYNWTGAGLNMNTGLSVIASPTTSTVYTVNAAFGSFGCSVIQNVVVGVISGSAVVPTSDIPSTCYPGGASTIALNSNLSAGNFGVSAIPFAPGQEANATNGVRTVVTNGAAVSPFILNGGSYDDGGFANIPLGFTYNFFGTNFNTIAAGTNGLLMFGNVPCYTTGNGCLGQYSFVTSPTTFPNASNPGNVIALMASDLYFTGGTNPGTIKYWNEGIAPTRRFVIQYANVPDCCSGTNQQTTVQCILYETTGIVEIHVTNKLSTRVTTIGLQDATKTIGAVAPGRDGFSSTISTPEAWRFSPPANYTYLWTPAAGLSSTTAGVTNYTVSAPGSFTYNVEVTNPTTGCTVNGDVSFDVLASPASPVISGNLNVCGQALTTLTSSAPTSGNTIDWYDAATGGTLVHTGTSFTTPILTASKTYYVQETGASCASVRTPVTVNWTAAPLFVIHNNFTNSTGDATFCGAGTVSPVQLNVLNASDNSWNPGNSVFMWSESNSGALNCVGDCGGNNNADLGLLLPLINSDVISVTATNSSNGCVATATMTIAAFDFPPFTPTASPATICAGGSSQLSAGLTATTFSAVCKAYSLETTTTPTVLASGGSEIVPTTSGSLDDGYWSNIPLGFNFNYFGTVMTQCAIGTNGVLMFGTPSTAFTFTGGFPSTNNAPNMIAVCASDLNLSLSGAVRYWVKGSAPNRVFVLEYDNVPGYTSGTFSGQCLLFEATGVVEIHISNANQVYGGGSNASKYIGLQDGTRTIGATAPNCSTLVNNYWNGVSDVISSPQGWKFTPPGQYSFNWSPTTGLNNATIENPIASPTSTTTYTLQITDIVSGCAVNSTVDVNVTPLPSAPSGTDSGHCGSQVPTASVSGTGTMLWYNAPAGGTLLQTGGNTYTSVVGTTTTFHVAASNGSCESSTRTPVTVTVTTPPAITVSSGTSICPGASANLSVSSSNDPNYSYVWTPSASLLNPNTATPTATPSTTTTYTVVATDNTAGPNAGCVIQGNVTIVVHPVISVTASSTNDPICAGTSTQLDATLSITPIGSATIGTGTSGSSTQTPYRALWGGFKQQTLYTAAELLAAGAQAGTPIDSIGFQVTTGTPAALGGFTIAYKLTNLSTISVFETGLTTVSGPASYTPVGNSTNMHYLSNPIIWDGVSNLIIETCFNNNNSGTGSSMTVLTSTVTGSVVSFVADGNPTLCSAPGSPSTSSARPNIILKWNVPYTYAWSPTTGLDNPAIKNPVASPATTTNYMVTATNTVTGCTGNSSVMVNVNAAPSAVVSPAGPIDICSGQQVLLSAGTGAGYTYLWSTFETTSSILVDQDGTYNVTISSPGCNPVLSNDVVVNVNYYTFTPTISSTVVNTPCPAASYDLSATGPVNSSWTWTGPNGFTAFTQNVNVTQSGLYTVTLDSAGCSSFPVSVNVSTNQCQSCATPTGLAHSNVGAGQADVSWSPAYIGDSFIIRYWDMATGIYQYKNIPSGQSSTTLDYLDWQNTTYVWQVKTICASPQPYSKYSVTDTFTTVAGTAMPCNYRPILPTTLGVTATTADLIWYPVDADAFIVRYEVAGTFNYKYQAVSGGIGNPSATQLVGLLPATDYNWWVLGICNGVKSRYSVMGNFQTDPGSIPCIKPFDTRGINIGTTTATVEWNGIVTADEFRVKYAVNTLPYVWKYKTVSGVPNVNTIALTGLTANTTYRFQVQTICSGIKSDYSFVELFTTLANPSGQSRSITEDVRGSLSLSAYPNPARDHVTVSFGSDNEGGKYLARLLDLSGRMLMERKGTAPKGQYQEEFKLEGLAAGMYLLEVRIGEKQGFLRLTVE